MRRQHRRHKLLPKSLQLARSLNDRVHSRSVIWRARARLEEAPRSTTLTIHNTTTTQAAQQQQQESAKALFRFSDLLCYSRLKKKKAETKTKVEKW